MSSVESWSSSAPTGVPQSLWASLGRAWSCLVSLPWPGQSPPRARFCQGRTLQGVSQQGPETHCLCQAVPWLHCRHCKHHPCSHVRHLSLPPHTCVTGKASGAWACRALSTARGPLLATSSQPGNAWCASLQQTVRAWGICGELGYCSSQKGLFVHAFPRSSHTTSVS